MKRIKIFQSLISLLMSLFLFVQFGVEDDEIRCLESVACVLYLTIGLLTSGRVGGDEGGSTAPTVVEQNPSSDDPHRHHHHHQERQVHLEILAEAGLPHDWPRGCLLDHQQGSSFLICLDT